MFIKFLIVSVGMNVLCACSGTSLRESLTSHARKDDPIQSLAERAHDIDSDKSVQDLKKDIKKQEKLLNQALAASQQLGQTYYLLGFKFIDYKMYGEALKYFHLAQEYYPQKSKVYYQLGACYGWRAETQAEPKKKQEDLANARFYLEKAVDLMPEDSDSLLALAISYSYYFDKPQEAMALIQRYHSIHNPTSISHFVQAHIAVQMLDYPLAIELYSDLAINAPTQEERDQAAANRDTLLQG